jgi:hypothetical protein
MTQYSDWPTGLAVLGSICGRGNRLMSLKIFLPTGAHLASCAVGTGSELTGV